MVDFADIVESKRVSRYSKMRRLFQTNKQGAAGSPIEVKQLGFSKDHLLFGFGFPMHDAIDDDAGKALLAAVGCQDKKLLTAKIVQLHLVHLISGEWVVSEQFHGIQFCWW